MRLSLFSNTTPYSANKTKDMVLKEIEYFSEVIFQWFDFNYMKVSSEKDHILYYSGNVNAKIGNDTIISEDKYEVLGVIFDSKLSFRDHINNLCRKASQKHDAVVRVAL